MTVKKVILFITQLMFALGGNAQTQQELRDSVSALSSLIDRNPHNVELRLRKAALHIEQDRWDYALEEYNKVLDMVPDNTTALYYRAFVHQHLHHYPFARKDYEALLAIDPENMHAIMGLTVTHLAEDHHTKAYDLANRLVTLYPTEAAVYAIRSEVEDKLGMKDAAIDDIEKSIDIEDHATHDTITQDDDMLSYQLTAFSLYIAIPNKQKALGCLTYLTNKGISKASLADYYSLLKP